MLTINWVSAPLFKTLGWSGCQTKTMTHVSQYLKGRSVASAFVWTIGASHLK